MYIFLDGQAAPTDSSLQSDYWLSADHWFEGDPMGQATLASLLQGHVLRRDGDSYADESQATVKVDEAAGTVTVTGALPNLSHARLVFAATLSTGTTHSSDRVELRFDSASSFVQRRAD